MKRRNFLKGLCLSPLAFLKKKKEPAEDFAKGFVGSTTLPETKWMQLTAVTTSATSCTCEYLINDDNGIIGVIDRPRCANLREICKWKYRNDPEYRQLCDSLKYYG